MAVVSQSGGCSFTLLNRAWRSGIGVSHVAVAGNELDISIPEFIEYYLHRPEVRSVACYIEAIRDPDGLRQVGALASELGKPVFVMKSGISESGQRAAAAHTGALATRDVVCDAAFRQWGLIRARTFDELIGAAALAGRFGAVGAQRFGVYAQGGGLAVVASDMFGAAHLDLAELSESTAARLHERMPDTTPGNPFDSGGQFLTAGVGVLTDALVDFACEESISSVVYMLMPVAGARLATYTEGIVKAAAQSTKPSVVLQYGAGTITQEATDQFIEAGILVLDPPEAGVSALALWSGSASRLDHEARDRPRRSSDKAGARGRMLVARWRAEGRRVVSEHDAGELLQFYGLRCARQTLVTDAAQLASATRGRVPPYVVKISSDDIPHRSDVGGVALGLANADEVAAAYHRVLASVRAARPQAVIQGVTVSETAPRGFELIVGMVPDDVFGPTVLVGLGGINAEMLKTTALRLPPLDASTSLEMIDELHGAALLQGKRGQSAVDVEAVVDVIVRFSELAVDLAEELTSVELNPLIAGPVGQGAIAVDALIELTRLPVADSD